jgi:hypothetical protein
MSAGAAIPDDRELKADLCKPRWKLTVRGIQVESKDDIIKRIGHSPDKGDSLVYASASKFTPSEGWVAFMGRQAAEAQLTAGWAKITADVDAGALAALVADGTAEVRENFGMKEWRRRQ